MRKIEVIHIGEVLGREVRSASENGSHSDQDLVDIYRDGDETDPDVKTLFINDLEESITGDKDPPSENADTEDKPS